MFKNIASFFKIKFKNSFKTIGRKKYKNYKVNRDSDKDNNSANTV